MQILSTIQLPLPSEIEMQLRFRYNWIQQDDRQDPLLLLLSQDKRLYLNGITHQK